MLYRGILCSIISEYLIFCREKKKRKNFIFLNIIFCRNLQKCLNSGKIFYALHVIDKSQTCIFLKYLIFQSNRCYQFFDCPENAIDKYEMITSDFFYSIKGMYRPDLINSLVRKRTKSILLLLSFVNKNLITRHFIKSF